MYYYYNFDVQLLNILLYYQRIISGCRWGDYICCAVVTRAIKGSPSETLLVFGRVGVHFMISF